MSLSLYAVSGKYVTCLLPYVFNQVIYSLLNVTLSEVLIQCSQDILSKIYAFQLLSRKLLSGNDEIISRIQSSRGTNGSQPYEG